VLSEVDERYSHPEHVEHEEPAPALVRDQKNNAIKRATPACREGKRTLFTKFCDPMTVSDRRPTDET